MKSIVLFFIVLFSFSLTPVFGQLTAAHLHSLNAPGPVGFDASYRRVSVEVDNGGSAYFFRIDNNINTIFVDRFGQLTNSWQPLASNTTFSNNYELNTYVTNEFIYCAVIGEDAVGNGRSHVYTLDADYNFNYLFSQALSGDYLNPGTSFVVDSNNEFLYLFSYDFNSGPVLDKYDISTGNSVLSGYIPSMGAGISSMALDEAANRLYVSFNYLYNPNEAKLYSVDLSLPSLNFDEVETGANVTMPGFFSGNVTLSKTLLVPKANDAPDVVFSFDDGTIGQRTYRKALGTATNGVIENNESLSAYAAAGRNSNSTFVVGNAPDNTIRVGQFLMNGTTSTVASDNNPVIYNGNGEQFRLAAPSGFDRVAGFYHYQGLASGPGQFFISNRAPYVDGFQKMSVCSGAYGDLVVNLDIADLDMDSVQITSITSSDVAILNPSTFSYMIPRNLTSSYEQLQ